MSQKKALTLKTITKSGAWDLQENDAFRLLAGGERDADVKENLNHYVDILRSAFEIETLKIDRPEVVKKYEDRGFKTALVKGADGQRERWAIKKKPIQRVTDLTYENIHHITAAKLIEVLERNFGGGWESLPQSIQDIIQSGFDISTTTLPANRLKRPGGMYEKKIEDGYEVLEIAKGLWTEAIFAKAKPEMEKQHMTFEEEPDESDFNDDNDENINEEEDDEEKDDDFNHDEEEDDDTFDDDKLTEESYLTTFDENPEDLEIADEEAEEEEY